MSLRIFFLISGDFSPQASPEAPVVPHSNAPYPHFEKAKLITESLI
jgi:hypothetical protein